MLLLEYNSGYRWICNKCNKGYWFETINALKDILGSKIWVILISIIKMIRLILFYIINVLIVEFISNVNDNVDLRS